MKQIHIHYINKIKDCDFRIFDAEDDENWRAVRSNERALDHWLDKAKIFDKDERQELLENCRWSNDDCVSVLEKLGWTILYGKENINK